MNSKADCLYVDGGVLANLCVAENIAEILAVLPYQCMLLPSMLHLRYPINDDASSDTSVPGDEEERARYVEVQTLVNYGSLHMCPAWDSDHMQLVVGLTDRFSDRAAHLVAWALVSGGAVGSDDPRTRRLIEEFFPDIRLVTTPELIQHWQVTEAVPDDEARAVIQEIRHRAFFTPATCDPLRAWWLSHLDTQ